MDIPITLGYFTMIYSNSILGPPQKTRFFHQETFGGSLALHLHFSRCERLRRHQGRRYRTRRCEDFGLQMGHRQISHLEPTVFCKRLRPKIVGWLNIKPKIYSTKKWRNKVWTTTEKTGFCSTKIACLGDCSSSSESSESDTTCPNKPFFGRLSGPLFPTFSSCRDVTTGGGGGLTGHGGGGCEASWCCSNSTWNWIKIRGEKGCV